MIDYFDKIYIIGMPESQRKIERTVKSFNHFYPDVKPFIYEAINTRKIKNLKNGHHVGCALSHRNVIEHAYNNNYNRILVFEEDTIFRKNFKTHFENTLRELMRMKWDLVKLGGNVHEKTFNKVEGCKYLDDDYLSTSSESLMINNTLFKYVLQSIPNNVNDIDQWIDTEGSAIDQYYAYLLPKTFKRYMSYPRLTTQDCMSGTSRGEKQEYKGDFFFINDVDLISGWNHKTKKLDFGKVSTKQIYTDPYQGGEFNG